MKTNMKTKIFTLMLTTIVNITSLYAQTYVGIYIGDLRYQLNSGDKTAIVLTHSSTYGDRYSQTNIVIPDTVIYGSLTYKVTGINGAFEGCAQLKSITIGKNIKSIDNIDNLYHIGAFYGCSSLETVTIRSNTVASWSKLSNVFGNQVTKYVIDCDMIGISTFSDCANLTTITIGNKVTSIGDYAFQNCIGLTSVVLPNNVTNIGNAVFEGCTGITSPIYSTRIFAYMPRTFSGSYSISSGLTIIAGSAFADCINLTSIAIPNSITTIGQSAFANCSALTTVTLPNKLTKIDLNTFSGCSALLSITLPNTIKNICDGAFSSCANLTTISMSNNIDTIGVAFQNCSSLTAITIPASVNYIGTRAFSGCSSLKNVTLNSSAIVSKNYSTSSYSGMQGFFGEQVEQYIIGSSISNIGNRAFYNCYNMTSITIGENVQKVGNYAFAYSSGLTNIELPYGMTKIGDDAFSGCENITTIHIPSSVKEIGKRAFYGCSAWRVVLPDSITHIGANALYNTFTYNLDRNWNNGVLCVNNYLIQGVDSKGLSASCSIQEGTTLIADAAFSGSSNLISVTLPASLRHIGNRAFYNCAKINSAIILPEHLETIGDSAMYFKSNIKTSFVYDLYLPRTLTYIGSGAFWNDNSNKAAISAIYAYMKTPPTIDTRTFNLQTSMANTPVYVYADDANKYFSADVWKQFDIQIISAPSVSVTDSIEIDITRTGATFKWQEIAQAKTYILVVQNQNGDTVEIVAINDQGEVKYDDRRLAKSSIASANGFQYTISNLENNTNYTYILQVKNASGNVLKEYSDSFVTGLRYSVRFVDWDDALLKEEIVRESESATPPENPSREGYTFIGWDKEYTNINSNLTIKAQYERDVVYYTVTFLDWDGSELFVEQVEEGQAAKGPSVLPTREGYTFTGWSKPITNIQSNLIVIAQYQLNEGIEDIYIDGVNSCKVIIDGQIFIIRGNKRYTVQGQEIR